MRSSTIVTLATLGSVVSGYQLPGKLKSLYDQHKVCNEINTSYEKARC